MSTDTIRTTPASDSPATTDPAECGTLLVVDDEEYNRDMLARRLRRKGYTVEVASSGPEALDLLAEGDYSLVLLDILMPGMSGIEVLERIRQRWSMGQLPVIMATAVTGTDHVVDALNKGANDYVTKPLNFPVVLARTSCQLTLRHALAQLELRNRFIRRIFGRFVSDQVVENLLETPDGLELGGQLQEVTVLFGDLRGFTTVSEQIGPSEVVDLRNVYLGRMTLVVEAFGGTIDEFIGDGILVLFGAPTPIDKPADRAVACALEMQNSIALVNAELTERGLPAVEMGIGINSGTVVAGNIGSELRMKYSVVGTAVNLAARIEACSVGGQVLVSEATLGMVEAEVRTGWSSRIWPKGSRVEVGIAAAEQIGAPWSIELAGTGGPRRVLAEPLPVRYALLAGVRIPDHTLPGALLELHPKEAVLRAPAVIADMSTIRLQVPGETPDDEGTIGIVSGHDEAGTFLVRFRSVDAALRRRIEASKA